MNKKPNLWERFKADTPKFEKIAQLVALILSVIIAHIHPVKQWENDLVDYLSGAFVAVAFFAQFATKVEGTIDGMIADPSQLLTLGPELLTHMGDIKASLQVLASPPAVVEVAEKPAATVIKIPSLDSLKKD